MYENNHTVQCKLQFMPTAYIYISCSHYTIYIRKGSKKLPFLISIFFSLFLSLLLLLSLSFAVLLIANVDLWLKSLRTWFIRIMDQKTVVSIPPSTVFTTKYINHSKIPIICTHLSLCLCGVHNFYHIIIGLIAARWLQNIININIKTERDSFALIGSGSSLLMTFPLFQSSRFLIK